MSVDKSWILLRNRFSKEYWNGAMTFLDRAKSFVNDQGKIHCPCKECRNVLHKTLDVVKTHIITHGFDVDYNTWTFHGEVDDVDIPQNDLHGGSVVVDEMVNVINDFIGLFTEERAHTDVNMDEDVAMSSSMSAE